MSEELRTEQELLHFAILDHLLADLGSFYQFSLENEVYFCLSGEGRALLCSVVTDPPCVILEKESDESSAGLLGQWPDRQLGGSFPVPVFLNPKALTALTTVLKHCTSLCALV